MSQYSYSVKNVEYLFQAVHGYLFRSLTIMKYFNEITKSLCCRERLFYSKYDRYYEKNWKCAIVKSVTPCVMSTTFRYMQCLIQNCLDVAAVPKILLSMTLNAGWKSIMQKFRRILKIKNILQSKLSETAKAVPKFPTQQG